VAQTLVAAGIGDILVVSGAARQAVEAEARLLAGSLPLRVVFNPEHACGGMLASLQAGLRGMLPGMEAVLVTLGDQPQVSQATIAGVCRVYLESGNALVLPVHAQHHGHPWLVARCLWGKIQELEPPATARDFLAAHRQLAACVPADASILLDLDTPEDYLSQKP
jgi:molybdenum cofactor cytidylyltransferase